MLLGIVLATMGLILVSAVGTTMLHSGRIGPAIAQSGRAGPSTALAGPVRPVRLAASASRHMLNGVFCNSPADCWAVGDHAAANGARLNQALHWDGKKWQPVAVPSQAGTGNGDTSELLAVRCLSGTDCWAVGDSQAAGSSAPELDQAVHWDGKHWLLARMPVATSALGRFAPSARVENSLTDLSCTAPDSCWAVGTDGGPVRGGAVFVNQMLHWDGQAWTVVPSTPDPAGRGVGDENVLAALHCNSSTDCWAAGEDGSASAGNFSTHNQVLHWTGGKWVSVPVPDPGGVAPGDANGIHALACMSPSDCWAAGSYGGPGRAAWLNELLHWDGAKWAQVRVPNPAGAGRGRTNVLNGVACASVTDCWAVGNLGASPRRDQALHWDGARWSPVTMPDPAGHGRGDENQLAAVRCPGPVNHGRRGGLRGSSPSSRRCIAVGLMRQGNVPSSDLIMVWTGSEWVVS
jgi:hypothetical protein